MKIGRAIIEFIVRPLSYLSEAHGKLIVSISVICLCLFATRPIGTDKFILPRAVEDTVGDIPLIEHLDDGKVEVVENPDFKRYEKEMEEYEKKLRKHVEHIEKNPEYYCATADFITFGYY